MIRPSNRVCHYEFVKIKIIASDNNRPVANTYYFICLGFSIVRNEKIIRDILETSYTTFFIITNQKSKI